MTFVLIYLLGCLAYIVLTTLVLSKRGSINPTAVVYHLCISLFSWVAVLFYVALVVVLLIDRHRNRTDWEPK